MKKNVSLLLFLLLIFTVGSAFYLTRMSSVPEVESIKESVIAPVEVVEIDSLKGLK